MKRIVCMTLVFLMLIPIISMGAASDWARESVDEARAIGILPQSFNEDNLQQGITREEFCEFVIRTLAWKLNYTAEEFMSYAKSVDKRFYHILGENWFSLTDKTENVLFSDTENEFVLTAADMGIVTGYGDSTFLPAGLITREEAAAMLSRSVFLASGVGAYSSFDYADSDLIAPWAVIYLKYYGANKLLKGVDGNKFDPKGTFTREQAAVTFVRMCEEFDFNRSDTAYKMKPSLEATLARFEESHIYHIDERYETSYGTVIYYHTGGAMHTGGHSLILIKNDGSIFDMYKDVPQYDIWGNQYGYDMMEFFTDEKYLTFTVIVEKDREFSKSVAIMTEEKIIVPKGKYVFVANLETEEVECTVMDLE